MNKEYVKGTYGALQGMDEHITASIKRNGGAQTTLQVLNVFNDILAKLHWEKQEAWNALQGWNETAGREERYGEPDWEPLSVQEFVTRLFADATTTKGSAY